MRARFSAISSGCQATASLFGGVQALERAPENLGIFVLHVSVLAAPAYGGFIFYGVFGSAAETQEKGRATAPSVSGLRAEPVSETHGARLQSLQRTGSLRASAQACVVSSRICAPPSAFQRFPSLVPPWPALPLVARTSSCSVCSQPLPRWPRSPAVGALFWAWPAGPSPAFILTHGLCCVPGPTCLPLYHLPDSQSWGISIAYC